MLPIDKDNETTRLEPDLIRTNDNRQRWMKNTTYVYVKDEDAVADNQADHRLLFSGLVSRNASSAASCL